MIKFVEFVLTNQVTMFIIGYCLVVLPAAGIMYITEKESKK